MFGTRRTGGSSVENRVYGRDASLVDWCIYPCARRSGNNLGRPAASA